MAAFEHVILARLTLFSSNLHLGKMRESLVTYVEQSVLVSTAFPWVPVISTASEGECLLNRIAVKYVCRWCDKAYYAHVVASMES